jgi:hypothetical protein
LWVALPAAVMPIGILGFVLVTEFAYDEARCPFREVARVTVAPGVAVVEDGRSCAGDVEERRWTLRRAGQARVLGMRRLDREAFAPGGYRWNAVVSEAGEVRVVVHNPGYGEVLFREGTAEEHARDQR